MARVMCIDPIIKILHILEKEGLLPRNKFKLTQIVKIIFHIISFSLILSINIIVIVQAIQKGSAMEFIRATYIIIPITQLIFKGATILINKQCFALLLDDLRSDIFNSHSIKLNAHIEFVYKVSDLLQKYYTLAIGLFIFVTAILPFIFNIRMMMPPPFDMGRYIFFYKIIHFLMTIYMAIHSISYDVMYMSFMALCIAQLSILQERLMNIFEESGTKSAEDLSVENNFSRKFIFVEQRILKQCIVLHDKINK